MKYILLSFYNRGDHLNPVWEVYGHIAPCNNDHLQTFLTRSAAIEYCHDFYSMPVIQGQGGSIDNIVEALSK